MRTLILSLVVLLGLALLAGCHTVPVAGECPESANLKCNTRKICTEDRKRGCQVCQCEGAWEQDPYRAIDAVETPPVP